MSSKRIQELDALRGLAAIGVLAFHYSRGYETNYGFVDGQPFDFRLGYLGVQLFFIISGFVILLTIERAEKPLDFVASRFSRLYPTFWAGVLATTGIVSISKLPNTERTFGEILINLTMLQEFFGVREVEGVYWTLTRELIFYGIVLIVFSIGLIRHVIPLAYGWLGIQLAANLISRYHGWFPWKIEFYLLTEYCHLFVAGIVFHRIYKGDATRACYGLLAFAAVNQFCLADQPSLPTSRFEEGCYVLSFFLLMWLVVKGKASFLAVQPLMFLGSISYALYLVHQFLGYSVIRYCETDGLSVWGGLVVAVAASLSIATLITWYVEKPASRWLRDRYRNSSGTAQRASK